MMLARYTEEIVGMELDELVGVHWRQGQDDGGTACITPGFLKPVSIKPPVRDKDTEDHQIPPTQNPRAVIEDTWSVSLIPFAEMKGPTMPLHEDTSLESVDGWNVSLASPVGSRDTWQSEVSKVGGSQPPRVHCSSWLDEGMGSPLDMVLKTAATPENPDSKTKTHKCTSQHGVAARQRKSSPADCHGAYSPNTASLKSPSPPKQGHTFCRENCASGVGFPAQTSPPMGRSGVGCPSRTSPRHLASSCVTSGAPSSSISAATSPRYCRLQLDSK